MKRKDIEKRAAKALELKNGEKPAKRQKTLKKKLKDEAWALFSRYIRLKEANAQGIAFCVTCKRPYHWKDLQAGHAVGGRGGHVLFMEKIVRCQCIGCNCMQKGKYPEFIDYLVNVEKSITIEEYFEIVRESHKPHKLKESDYEAIILKYDPLVKELENRLGIV